MIVSHSATKKGPRWQRTVFELSIVTCMSSSPPIFMYMNPKWGERIPCGKPRTKHGMTRYFLGDGKPIRPPSDVVSFHENRMADRFNESLARDYDNVSQLAAMDKEGLDIAVLFRTSPLHTNES